MKSIIFLLFMCIDSFVGMHSLPTQQVPAPQVSKSSETWLRLRRLALLSSRHSRTTKTLLVCGGLCLASKKVRHALFPVIYRYKPLMRYGCRNFKSVLKMASICALAAWYKITTFWGLHINDSLEYDQCKRTRLCKAVDNHDNMRARALLYAGANPFYHGGPWFGSPFISTISQGNVELVKAFLASHIDSNRVYNGMLPLFVAAQERQHGIDELCELDEPCYREIAKILINAGADLNRRDSYEETPLFGAVFGTHPEMVRFLLEKGADPNVYDKCGCSPLFYACTKIRETDDFLRRRQPEIVYDLVKAGATTFSNKPRFDLRFHPEILSILKHCMYMATERNDSEAMRALIRAGAPYAVRDEHGSTFLHQLIGAYNPVEHTPADNMVRQIICVAGINAMQVRDSSGRTPLHCAVQKGNMWLTTLLLQKGAEVNAQDNIGNTPLHYVSENGPSRIIDLLISHGADLALENRRSEKPLNSQLIVWNRWIEKKIEA